ncbi:MAG: alpha/beta hydrolase [Desulfobacterales bacterium]|nr:alpha/beta hydrolase [Desulfobacterales bacterium]
MKLLKYISLILFFIIASTCNHQKLNLKKNSINEHDLVLIHGLTNKHPWGEKFLGVCLNIWGSENVYTVYLNESDLLSAKKLNDKIIYSCGKDDSSAGDQSIETQAFLLEKKIKLLQEKRSLNKNFSIIAHSMGGLVSRAFIHKNPNTVNGLVTLGTPHKGSPLADNFEWAGFFMNATEAISNLKPEFIRDFNKKYPIYNSPLADNGKIYTIRGDCDGKDCFGWGGELMFGWTFIKLKTNKDNDGLVPYDSAIIEGAIHIADYPDFDHSDLVKEPEVAARASYYLYR